MQIAQTVQCVETGHGVVLEIQVGQRGHGGQHVQIPDGVLAQIQIGKALRAGQLFDGAQAAFYHAQLGQGGKSRNDGQIVRAEPAAAEVKRRKLGQRRQALKTVDVLIGNGQLFQIGHERQVGVDLRVLGDGEFRDLPQLAGVDAVAVSCAGQLPQSRFHGRVGEFDFLNDAGHSVAQNRQGTDKAVIAHGDGVNGRLTGGEGNGAFVNGVLHGGVFTVGGVVELPGGVQGDVDILAVVARLVVADGGVRPLRLDLGLDIRVRDFVQQRDGVQQFVLLHVGLAQGGEQLGAGFGVDGIGQGVLGFRVVVVGLIQVRQLDGHVLVVVGEVVGKVIEP